MKITIETDQIKVALLAIIAGTLIIQTFLEMNDNNAAPSYVEKTTGMPPAPVLTQSQPGTPSMQAQAQPATPSMPPTSIKFVEEDFSFGNIKQNSTDNMHIFKFANTGNNPLLIQNARGSCGCTVPEWPKEPVPPGGTGEIKVIYNPGKQKGNQRKTVTVTANTEPKDTKINISAFVEEVPE